MKYLSSTDEFFNQSRLFEALGQEPFDIWERINSLTFSQYEPATVQESAAMLNHQVYLLSTFDTVEEIYQCENLLIKNGYDPVFLTLEGAYLETVAALAGIKDVSEGFIGDTIDSISNFFSKDSNKPKDGTEDESGIVSAIGSAVKSFFSTMTEGGSAIGILQFVLDIIGIIPVGELTLGTIPLNQAANLLNAIISFYRGHFLLGLISLGMGIPGVGQVLFAPIKLISKPFTAILGKFSEVLWKGDAALTRAATAEFKAGALAIDPAAKSSTGIITMLGNGLKKIATYIGEVGLKIVGGIVDFIGAALNIGSFGIIPKPKAFSKWIGELSTKLGAFSKTAAEAGELLLKDEAKVVASAERAAGKAEASALAAGETAAEAEAIAKKFANVPGFTNQIVREVASSPGYLKLANSSNSIKNMYLTYGTSEKLIGNILAAEGQITGKSLLELLKTPGMVKELEKAGFRGVDKVLVDAIKTGDSAVVAKTLESIVSTPGAMKLVSPNVAKTISIFKEAPELLVKGPKALKEVQSSLTKLANSGGKKAYVGVSGRALIALFLKAGIKSSECLMYLGSGSEPTEVFDKISGAAMDKASSLAPKILSSDSEVSTELVTEDEKSDLENALSISKEEVERLKSENPEGYKALTDQVKSARESIKDLSNKAKPENPCSIEAAASEAVTGTIVSQTGLYKQEGSGDVTDVDTEEEQEALMRPVKSTLRLLGQDSDIDPQHSLTSADPYTKAYFSDVWDWQNEVMSPNVSGPSRLDKTLDFMEKEGDLNSSQREDVKAETLKHWENGTMPAEVMAVDEPEESLQENRQRFHSGKINSLRVGKLITRR